MIKTWLFLVRAALLLPLAAFGQDGEFKLTFGWDFKTETGNIQDMHFMPGESQFIMTTGGVHFQIDSKPTLQIRDTKTGELIEKIPGLSGHLEFTTDSTKVILAINNGREDTKKIKIWDLQEKYVAKEDSFKIEGELKDPHGNPFYYQLEAMVADPIRAHVYIIVRKSNLTGPGYIDTTRVIIYDYDKMQTIADLTPAGFADQSNFEKLAVSKDGKYLAALNEGRAHLWVWDLETRERITSLRLYDGTHGNEFSTMIWDMKFSEIDTKKLYFTCFCYGNSPYRGLTIYDVEQNKVTDGRFMNNGAASFTLFDEEQRMFLSLGEKEILNIEKGFIEYQYSVDSPNPGTWSIVLYSPINDLLVGRHGYLVSAGIYSKGTGIEAEDNEVLIAYPNPSSYLVHIPYVCLDTTAKCQILNTKGHVLDENVMVIRNDELQIDLSRYPTGTYFVKLYCGDTVKSYQIVKEG